ncbi:hypothetical protein D3272_02070 [Lichenibacterium ramalinae]|uniref:Uncharacterized protein n=1 Tax=Lichenibacterium ramalinae TaxID=2316527 RepID=A0A4Q2RKV6_9HYPH|nr:hypothetical protein D3272_02070 [Lichenibacterium ramalinae]
MSRREGNRPDRRIAAATMMDERARHALSRRVTYVGSATHKLHPGDYGFQPPQNPRPTKSPCDAFRSVLLGEAQDLFRQGIMRGMVSAFGPGQVPKYVWCVDAAGEVYEAKTRPERETRYHGYRIGPDERDMCRYVLKEWMQRCR